MDIKDRTRKYILNVLYEYLNAGTQIIYELGDIRLFRHCFERYFCENGISKDEISDYISYLCDKGFLEPLYRFPNEKMDMYAVKLTSKGIDHIEEKEEKIEDRKMNFEFPSNNKDNNVTNLKLIFKNFHKIAKRLLIRHTGRSTIKIDDEYDVQDLMAALLEIFFDDIRPEEYTPSYAGKSSRIDFLLEDKKIALEIKKTRESLKGKEIGDELLIDIQRYKSHPSVKKLICFIYDPDGQILNPKGLEKDLMDSGKELNTEVFIIPQS
jgi:hypothetical protein